VTKQFDLSAEQNYTIEFCQQTPQSLNIQQNKANFMFLNIKKLSIGNVESKEASIHQLNKYNLSNSSEYIKYCGCFRKSKTNFSILNNEKLSIRKVEIEDADSKFKFFFMQLITFIRVEC
jgi:hypothetical protein